MSKPELLYRVARFEHTEDDDDLALTFLAQNMEFSAARRVLFRTLEEEQATLGMKFVPRRPHNPLNRLYPCYDLYHEGHTVVSMWIEPEPEKEDT